MKLTSVHVKNYRCLADVSVDMTDLTVLLGPNSAGKSSLLHALDFFFKGRELEPADVFGGRDATISVECAFDDLNDADRGALVPMPLAIKLFCVGAGSLAKIKSLPAAGGAFLHLTRSSQRRAGNAQLPIRRCAKGSKISHFRRPPIWLP